MTATTLTLEYVRSLYSNPEVVAEARRMQRMELDYSTHPMFEGGVATLGMYNYCDDGVWLVDTRDSAVMDDAVKLMRVI